MRTLNRIILPLTVACLAVAFVATAGEAQMTPYTVTRGRLVSEMQPAIRLDIDTALTYVGSQRWILYNVAQAEQHLFVQRSADGVRKFLWVQFEEYIPSSNGKYDYSKSTPISAFGRELRVDKELWNVPTTEARPESDGAHARKLLRDNGITLPPHLLYERFIYLPDSIGRRELMVIYAEDVRSVGVDVSALQGSPEAKARLNALLNELEQRALRTFRISPRSGP
jgi:hypothetical protein